MKHGDLFPIGAVAKLYHISVGTLRLYEPSDMELPIQRLVKGRNRDMVFLGKVGIGISEAWLKAGEFSQYVMEISIPIRRRESLIK